MRCRRTCVLNNSKDENVRRFALSAKKGEHLERERERERKRRYTERYSFGMFYTGYLLSIVKIKRERDRERE